MGSTTAWALARFAPRVWTTVEVLGAAPAALHDDKGQRNVAGLDMKSGERYGCVIMVESFSDVLYRVSIF